MKKVSVFLGLTILILLASVATRQTVLYAAPVQRTSVQENVCAKVPRGYARCLAVLVRSQQQLHPLNGHFVPAGYGPAELQNAYKLPSATAGAGQTIAIVDAYDNPVAESDLAVYRAQYHLPPCTTANGCFKKVDQNGGNNYPATDTAWPMEIALDLDIASAICPNCHLLLVEANSASFANLGHAVETAVRLKANVISNSYGGYENWADAMLYARYYSHPGVAITASAGDNGYGVELPAAYNTVTAVGGTTLTPASNARGWSETVWDGTGSGCSAYINKPGWQIDTGCKKRTVADVAAVADTKTAVAAYYSYNNAGGWIKLGGTSVSAPIIAGVYALAGNSARINAAAYPYAHSFALNVVTSGSNGVCEVPYLCSGANGYNGPTGLGTPNGVDAF
ncbi:MAG TPA: S53 family peptidase [Ktedonobacteraceae bacterium]